MSATWMEDIRLQCVGFIAESGRCLTATEMVAEATILEDYIMGAEVVDDDPEDEPAASAGEAEEEEILDEDTEFELANGNRVIGEELIAA